MRIGLTSSNRSLSIRNCISLSVNTRSFSCDSSRAMPNAGPPQPACKSILMESGSCWFSKKFLIMLLAFSVTSNINPPFYSSPRGRFTGQVPPKMGMPPRREISPAKPTETLSPSTITGTCCLPSDRASISLSFSGFSYTFMYTALSP